MCKADRETERQTLRARPHGMRGLVLIISRGLFAPKNLAGNHCMPPATRRAYVLAVKQRGRRGRRWLGYWRAATCPRLARPARPSRARCPGPRCTSGLRAGATVAQSASCGSATVEAYEAHKRMHTDQHCTAEGLQFVPLVAEACSGGWGPTAAATWRVLGGLIAARSGDGPSVETALGSVKPLLVVSALGFRVWGFGFRVCLRVLSLSCISPVGLRLGQSSHCSLLCTVTACRFCSALYSFEKPRRDSTDLSS